MSLDLIPLHGMKMFTVQMMTVDALIQRFLILL